MGFKRSRVRISPARCFYYCFGLMFYVYVLRSNKTGRRYVGSSEDPEARLLRHNAGHSKATRHGIPWILLYRQSFATRSGAAQKERYYKTGRGRDEIDKLHS